MSFLKGQNQSRTEAVVMWAYAFLFLAVIYVLAINFTASDHALSLGKTFSLPLAVLLSIPLPFYKGWADNTTRGKKLFALIVLFLIIWATSWGQITQVFPWVSVHITGMPHEEVVKVYERDSKFLRGRGHYIRTKTIEDPDVRYRLWVPSSFYESVPIGGSLRVSGIRNKWGFRITDIDQI